MSYSFRSNPQYFTASEDKLSLLFANEVVDYTYSLTNPFVSQKMELDYYVANRVNQLDMTTLYGDFLGYASYSPNGYINLSLTSNVTYFALALRSDNSGHDVIFDSRKTTLDGNFSDNGYNAIATSPVNYEISLNNDYTFNDYEPFYDVLVDYLSADEDFSLLFDYRLALDNTTYRIRGEDINFYTSYFQCLCYEDDYFELLSGYSNVEDAAYERGLQIGYSSGLTNGKDIGFNSGYYQGYLKGKIEGEATTSFFGLIGNAVESFTPVLNLEVLPNVTLGTCISVPIICMVLVIIFKIARG